MYSFETTRQPAEPEEVYPDAAGWSQEEVAAYFREKGFTDQADAFRAQVGTSVKLQWIYKHFYLMCTVIIASMIW